MLNENVKGELHFILGNNEYWRDDTMKANDNQNN